MGHQHQFRATKVRCNRHPQHGHRSQQTTRNTQHASTHSSAGQSIMFPHMVEQPTSGSGSATKRDTPDGCTTVVGRFKSPCFPLGPRGRISGYHLTGHDPPESFADLMRSTTDWVAGRCPRGAGRKKQPVHEFTGDGKYLAKMLPSRGWFVW